MSETWNSIDKNKLTDKNIVSVIDNAKIDIYNTTNKNSSDFQGNLNSNWLPRTKMWDDYDFKSGKESQGWNDEWTKKILQHEREAGAPNGRPFGSGAGYDDKDWIENGKFVKEYVDKVKKEIPNFDQLPPETKVRLVDYKFNTGRSTKDLLTYALRGSRISASKKPSKEDDPLGIF